MQPTRQSRRIPRFAPLLIIFVVALAYWLWRAHGQVSLEIELACHQPDTPACAAAKSRYLTSFATAWLAQMFPWVLVFVPAFGYVIFFRWLARHRNV